MHLNLTIHISFFSSSSILLPFFLFSSTSFWFLQLRSIFNYRHSFLIIFVKFSFLFYTFLSFIETTFCVQLQLSIFLFNLSYFFRKPNLHFSLSHVSYHYFSNSYLFCGEEIRCENCRSILLDFFWKHNIHKWINILVGWHKFY